MPELPPEVRLVPIPTRHPLQIFIFVMCIISGAPVLTGKVPGPGTLEAAMPGWLVLGWAGCLVFGSIVVLAGTFWGNRVTGLAIEQVGLVAVGSAALVYSSVLLKVHWGSGNTIPAALILGFGLSCLFRWWQLQRYLHGVADAVALVQKG